MKFTQKVVPSLILLNSIFSTPVKSEFCQECCEDLFLVKNHFVVKAQLFGGTSLLSIKCSENSETNVFRHQKSCNLSSKIFHELHAEHCSSEDLLVFANEYPRSSAHVKVLEYNLYNKDKIIRLTQNLLSRFPRLEKISLLHANLELGSDDIIWPKHLTILSIYNSPQVSLPFIIGSYFKKLIIDQWPNLENISTLNVFHDLEELTLKDNHKLTSLPAKIFMKNRKLRELKIYNNRFLTKLHSNTLFGLSDLTSIYLWGNPITSLPSGFFTNAPALTTISWEEDICSGISNRTMPSDMLKGVHSLTKFNYSQHYMHPCRLIIEKSAFRHAYDTLKELKITKTKLGSNELIHQLAQNFKNLTKLLLQDNNIHDVHPDDIPKSIRELKIAHNPFACKCTTVSALNALMIKVTISDIKFIEFSDCPNSDNTPVIFSIAQTKLDCTLPLIGIFIGILIAAIVIVIVIGCIILPRMRVWLYNNKVFSYLYPGETEHDKFDNESALFDVFLTYAESDRQIMEKMYLDLSSGSRGRAFKCAVHEKDFVPGQSIEHNMRNLIMRSRRTIALVSQHYLNSQFCVNELEMAIASNGGKRLLVVVLDIAALNLYMRSNQTLRSYFKAYTYLDFDNGSPSFYKRLMYALPHKKMEVKRQRTESGEEMLQEI